MSTNLKLIMIALLTMSLSGATLGQTHVAQYTVNPDGTLTAQATATVATGTGRRGILVEPSGRFVYVVNQTAGSVSQFFINSDGTLGSLSPPTVVTTPSRSSPTRTGTFT